MTRTGKADLATTRRVAIPRDPARRRVGLLLVIYLAAILGIGTRLVNVQVVDADRYAAIGAAQRARTIDLSARRGRLYDRQGDVLATSIDAATIYADPRAFRSTTRDDGLVVPPASDPREAARQLAPLLGGDQADIEALLTKDAHFVYLTRQTDWAVGQQVVDLGIHGIGRIVEPSRVYPAGSLAGQLLGFVGIDGDGLAGMETQYDSLLQGTPGTLAIERDPSGLAIASGLRELVPPVAGSDLVLTIDRQIQHVAEQAALNAVGEFNALSASVVVLEVGTGEILAMASAPGFDPNEVAASDSELRRNRSVTDLFEPGSVQKAVTAAAAIEEGTVTPDTRMLVEDRIRVGSKTFSDSHDHPPLDIDFREVIETSSNVGTIMVAQQLGEDRLASYLERFGYGQRLGVGFPGESPGLVLPRDQWWNTSLPTIAIGQGVAVTLLQAATTYSTLANDGVMVQPRLLRGTVGEDGKLNPVEAPSNTRVVSAATARTVRDMLAGVVAADGGTGRRAAVNGYDVAGKTGTARKPNTDTRGYSGKYIATFVGMAPVENPRIVVAVMVDEPYPIYGGVVAAPVFSEVMEFALTHRRVPPTNPTATLNEAFDKAERDAVRIAAERAAAQEGPATDDPDAVAGQTAPSDRATPAG